MLSEGLILDLGFLLILIDTTLLIRLFDSKGQLVKNDLVTFSFKNTLQIHQKGLYFVVSSNKNETLIKKIIVQ